MKIKKDVYINDDGEIGYGVDGGLPKGWAKGKLVARAGDEMPDIQAKALGIKNETKAKAPAENKSK